MKTETISFDKKEIREKNPFLDEKLLREIAKLREEIGKTATGASYNLEPPLGGALPSLKLCNY